MASFASSLTGNSDSISGRMSPGLIMVADILVLGFLRSGGAAVFQYRLLSALLEKDVSDTPSDGWK